MFDNLKIFPRRFCFEMWHRKCLLILSSSLPLVLVSDRSAAVLKAGGGAAVKEHSVAGRTELDMREKGKHSSRSAGFMDRRVIVHRSADRGALRFCPLGLLSVYCAHAFGRFWSLFIPLRSALCALPSGCCEKSCVWFYRKAPDIPLSGCAAASDSTFL